MAQSPVASVAYEYDSKLWHTRLFLWSCRLWHVFLNGREPERIERTNICHYIHSFGLATVALFSQILFWGGVVVVSVILPKYLFEWYGILMQLMIVGVMGVVGVAFGLGILGVGAALDYLENTRRDMRGPRFIKVCKDWIRAKKEKTCWQIAITYDDDIKKMACTKKEEHNG